MQNLLTYAEQLRDPRWQRRKTEIMRRDNFTCQDNTCKRTDLTLNVHHLEYFALWMAWDYPDNLLLTLCEKCHNKEKYRRELDGALSTAFKMNGFLYSDLLCLSTLLHTKKFAKSLLKTLRKTQNG